MAAPRTTVWDLEPHTRAKHEILKRYLEAWTPILALGGFPEIIYMDGFAGRVDTRKGRTGRQSSRFGQHSPTRRASRREFCSIL